MRLKIISGPENEPVEIAEVKKHINIDFDDDDDFLKSLIIAAREYAEDYTGIAYITRSYELYRDCFPFGGTYMPLMRQPVQSITKVEYITSLGDTLEFDSTKYFLDPIEGSVVLNLGSLWPDTTLRPKAGVKITYVAGYADNSKDVPMKDKQAMLLLIGHWYENREAVAIGNFKEVPMAVKSLLSIDRIINI